MNTERPGWLTEDPALRAEAGGRIFILPSSAIRITLYFLRSRFQAGKGHTTSLLAASQGQTV